MKTKHSKKGSSWIFCLCNPLSRPLLPVFFSFCSHWWALAWLPPSALQQDTTLSMSFLLRGTTSFPHTITFHQMFTTGVAALVWDLSLYCLSTPTYTASSWFSLTAIFLQHYLKTSVCLKLKRASVIKLIANMGWRNLKHTDRGVLYMPFPNWSKKKKFY